MICNNCGAMCNDDAKFCRNCGAALTAQNNAQNNTQNNTSQYGYTQYQQTQYQQPQYQQVYVEPMTYPGKGLGIAGMVVGIVSLVLMCLFYFSLPAAITGAILSGIALSKSKAAGVENKMAVAGLVCSIIALGIALIFLVIMISLAAASVFAY